MGWQDILKLTPKLKKLAGDKDFTVTYIGDEAQMKEMWDASNPDSPHELRSSVPRFAKYPIEEWYGVIIDVEGNKKLVSVSGFTIKQGKEGKDFAYVGGTKTAAGHTGKKYAKTVREKTWSLLENIPKINGITKITMQSTSFMPSNSEAPSSHPVIPDEVIGHFRTNYKDLWGINKWVDWED